MVMVVGVWSLVGSRASFDRPIGTRKQVGTTFCHVQNDNCEKTKHERVAASVGVSVVFDGKGIGGWMMTDSTTKVRQTGGRFDPPLRWNAHPSLTVNDE